MNPWVSYLKLFFAFLGGIVVGVWAMTLLGKQNQILQNTKAASLLRAPELITLAPLPTVDTRAFDQAWVKHRTSLVREFEPADYLTRPVAGTARLRLDDLDLVFQLEIEPFERNFRIRLTGSHVGAKPQIISASEVGLSSQRQTIFFHLPPSFFLAAVEDPALYDHALNSWAEIVFGISVEQFSGAATIYGARTFDAGDPLVAIGTLSY